MSLLQKPRHRLLPLPRVDDKNNNSSIEARLQNLEVSLERITKQVNKHSRSLKYGEEIETDLINITQNRKKEIKELFLEMQRLKAMMHELKQQQQRKKGRKWFF